MIRQKIIHPRRRFVALPLWKDSKLRSLKSQIVTSENVLFPLASPTNGFVGLRIPSMFWHILPQPTGLVKCKDKKYKWNHKEKKKKNEESYILAYDRTKNNTQKWQIWHTMFSLFYNNKVKHNILPLVYPKCILFSRRPRLYHPLSSARHQIPYG